MPGVDRPRVTHYNSDEVNMPSDELKEAVQALIDAAYNTLAELDHYAVGETAATELEEAVERVRELL